MLHIKLLLTPIQMHRMNKEEPLELTSDSINSIESLYKQNLDFLYNQLPMFQNVGKVAFKANLDNTYSLCEILDNPQKKIKTIHIAGTNGKGSVAHMLAAIFQSAGYKTGLYTSPHYTEFRERIKVNGEMVSKSFVNTFLDKVRSQVKEMQPSFFELTVAMAFDYFRNEQTDINIIETGMGGRLDSTNVILPELTIITNIGLDHTAFLGDTLELIAAEKAGIIKENTAVVCGAMNDSALQVIKNIALSRNAPVYQTVQSHQIKSSSNGTFDYDLGEDFLIDEVNPSLKGAFQQENIHTVLTAIKILKNKFNLDVSSIKNGLENTRELTSMWGRLHFIAQNPTIVLDGAHNEEAIKSVINDIKAIKYENLHIIIGFVSDKNPEKFLKYLPINAAYYISKPSVIRGMDVNVLAGFFVDSKREFSIHSTVNEAYLSAVNKAGNNDCIFVTGSIFTVSDVLVSL
ncbi:MAG: bifunctional folylpolyglutamate synthase/dihydrofolate synthase [Chitinophagaceae bacterium]|nr:MAG: bifunctional folylpolyglutamate synthase/dihydrofolate synthase [Chitinophagaceae bacterium]